ncbi:unnamed protein product [Urochloa humidicola]
MRRGSVFLCCCGSCVRRRRGCGEVDAGSFDACFTDISDGFPVCADGISIRLGFLYLCWLASSGRRRWCGEDNSGRSSSVGFFITSGGFPALVGGDGARFVYLGGFFGGCFRFFYQLEKSGWLPSTTSSGGLLPLPGDSLSGAPGLLVIEAPDPLLSGDVMAFALRPLMFLSLL